MVLHKMENGFHSSGKPSTLPGNGYRSFKIYINIWVNRIEISVHDHNSYYEIVGQIWCTRLTGSREVRPILTSLSWLVRR